MGTVVLDFGDPFAWPWFVIAVLTVIVAAILVFLSGAAEWRLQGVILAVATFAGIIAALYALVWVIRLGVILFL